MSNVNTYYHSKRWTVQYYDTGASIWIGATGAKWPAASINPFTRKYVSTSTIVDLADGGRGMHTPSTHRNIDPITLAWHPRTVTSALRTNLKTYLDDHTGLKVTIHDDTILEGYIMYIDEVFPISSGETQTYGLMIELQPFDVDSSGSMTE